jgi:hypothetical protein
MYFRGKRQSEEFARGAGAVVDLMVKIEAQAKRGAGASTEAITAALADDFADHGARGGDYSRGFVTAIVEILAFGECVGNPNLDVWRPLRMDLRYTSRAAHPTPGSKLYELDGAAVSVAPDLTVHTWHDYDENRIERSAAFLARIQKHGQPISARRFDELRRAPEAETAEAANG